MSKIPRCFFLFVLLSSSTFSHSQSTAKDVLQKAIRTMGSGWDTIKTLAYEEYANQFVVDQSERSEGPYIPGQVSRGFLIDLATKKAKISENAITFNQESNLIYLLNDSNLVIRAADKMNYFNGYDELRTYTALAPQFVLQTAMNAADLKLLKDSVVQRAPHFVIAFTHMNYPVKIYINKETNFLTATEIRKPFLSGLGGFSRIWGDARVVTYYSFWNFLSDGVHYPFQKDTYLNDYYMESSLIRNWSVNAPLSADSLTIPDSVIQKGRNSAFQKITLKQPVEIAKDVWVIPGPCNSTIVKQDDGVVIIESGSSSAYGEALLDKAKALYPGSRIKAFVATADAWLHLGGIRAMATTGATIYFPFRNETLVKKILDAPYNTRPDLLARTGKGHYKLNPVKQVTTIGDGKNQIQLYPYNTETGDRMMMAYFPEHKIVYCSDLFQPKLGGHYWQPHYIWEVANTIRRYKIPAARLYAMHQSKLLSVDDIEKDFPE